MIHFKAILISSTPKGGKEGAIEGHFMEVFQIGSGFVRRSLIRFCLHRIPQNQG
jgi:hypothetical protein